MKHERIPNVALIERTIEEIRRSPDFDMARWQTCIYGHVCRAARVSRELICTDLTRPAPVTHGAILLGISDAEAHKLFCNPDFEHR